MRVGVWGRTYSHRLSRVLASGTSGKPRRKPLHCMGCIGAVVLYGTDGAAGTSLELYGTPPRPSLYPARIPSRSCTRAQIERVSAVRRGFDAKQKCVKANVLEISRLHSVIDELNMQLAEVEHLIQRE